MCLNEICFKVRIGKKSVWCISYSEWSETRRCFITIAFQFCFKLSYLEVPRNSGCTGIERITSCLCWKC